MGSKFSNLPFVLPVFIGPEALVKTSYNGPSTALGKNCLLIKSGMGHSVVLVGSSIMGVSKLTDSLLGRDVEVMRSVKQPRGLRLMLGDDSKVELE